MPSPAGACLLPPAPARPRQRGGLEQDRRRVGSARCRARAGGRPRRRRALDPTSS